jgi:polysaccharide chain length determinant protein (PEP-CTERM system associated)
MHDLIRQLQDYAQGMWRYRFQAVVTAWIVCLVGWLVVLALPPVYQATARVYVDTTAVLKPLLEGIAVEQDVRAQLNYVRQAMLSRPQLERVARETDLDLSAVTPQQQETMLEKLAENIKIESLGSDENRRDQSSLYTISVEGVDRQKSLKVVQSLVNSFVEDTLGGKRTGSDAAQRFLRDQIAEYDRRLAEAESRLAAFKKDNIGLVPGAQGDYFSRLQGETDAAQRVEAQLRVANQRRAELARQLNGEKPSIGAGAMSSPVMLDMTSQIIAAQKNLDELLLRYTDKHPDVIAARETLAQLQTRQATELAAMQSGRGSVASMAGMAANPVYQQIQLQMNQVDVEIASYRSELALRQQNIANLRSMLDTAPEVEAEFARLARDYDVTKARYNELVNRLDRAQISEQAEQTGVVRFEVIDPPSVRLEPIAPNRPRLLVMVLLAGLLAGVGVAFLGQQLRPTFTSSRTLTEITGLPVLGAVARTWLDRYKAQQRVQLLRLAGATGALVLVFAVVLVFQDSGSQLLTTLIRRA